MKYLSYVIIIAVISLVGWTTNNSIHSIFPTKNIEKTVLAQSVPKITEKETLPGMLDSMLSN